MGDSTGNVRRTSILLKNPLFWRQHLGFVALSARQIPGSSPHVAGSGANGRIWADMMSAELPEGWA